MLGALEVVRTAYCAL